MILLHNNPEYLLSYDRDFIILTNMDEVSQDRCYVVYNSVNHSVAKLSKVEFLLLDLLYKYGDPDYISSSVDKVYRIPICDLLKKDSVLKLIDTDNSQEQPCEYKEKTIPSTYYLHLTNRCNLKCTYCYNQKQRLKKEELPFEKWRVILDKILPHANHIILTGGECFLYEEIGKIVQYIKAFRKDIFLSCISNGMHNYASLCSSVRFEEIDSIMFSCDSLEREGKRIGFKPDVFHESINFLLSKYPNLSLEISATRTADNENDLSKIRSFCSSIGIYHRFINLIPQGIDDIKDMPMTISCFSHCYCSQTKSDSYNWPAKNIRCGAGFKVLSVSSKGDAYPCQALHYREFLMGNLLEMDVSDLKYIKDQSMCLPSVDEIKGCKHCNLRYLCGGGCLAVSYPSNGFKFKRNRLICPFNYENAMSRLINIIALKSK